MAGPRAKGDEVPDPLGKRALYSGARPAAAPEAGPASAPAEEGARFVPDLPVEDGGAFTVRCLRCRQVSHVGLLDLVIFQFPVGLWLPRGRFDRRMTCPSCRKRAWCSVTWRRRT